jgi:hypothetical protein
MARKTPEAPQSTPHANAPAGHDRRQFLAKAAVAAVGVPTLLAACADGVTQPQAAPTGGDTTPSPRGSLAGGRSPAATLHYMMAATIGTSTDVQVPALEKGTTTTYLQRVVTDNDRTGTGLATILRATYTFSNGTTARVVVQDSFGRTWPARTVKGQSDLTYAMKDALATNPLHVGVLRDSLTAGNPVVALSKSSVIAFRDSVASDYYGNHLDLASRGFSDIFNTSVAGIKLASTMRDLNRC